MESFITKLPPHLSVLSQFFPVVPQSYIGPIVLELNLKDLSSYKVSQFSQVTSSVLHCHILQFVLICIAYHAVVFFKPRWAVLNPLSIQKFQMFTIFHPAIRYLLTLMYSLSRIAFRLVQMWVQELSFSPPLHL